MKLLRKVLELPLATLFGAVFGGLVALVGAALSLGPLEHAPRPLAVFAIAPVPAVLGAWIDWSRLWKPTPRVGLYSGLALFASLWLGLVAAVEPDGMAGILWAPGLLVGAALGALSLRPASLARVLGWETVSGRVRRDECDRVVLDTPGGVVDLGREVPALGSHRELDLSTGRPLAVLARLIERTPDRDPFRCERRSEARSILAVARTEGGIDEGAARRARAWCGYLLGLAVLTGALAAGLGYAPDAAPPAPRSLVVASR